MLNFPYIPSCSLFGDYIVPLKGPFKHGLLAFVWGAMGWWAVVEQQMLVHMSQQSFTANHSKT